MDVVGSNCLLVGNATKIVLFCKEGSGSLNCCSAPGSITGTFKDFRDDWVVAVCVFKGVSFDVRKVLGGD